MPIQNIYHDAVRNALQRDEWTITLEPVYLPFDGFRLEADFAAQKTTATEELLEIVVEVKDFLNEDDIYENCFPTALGQYMSCAHVLNGSHPTRRLYLAISEHIYNSFFTLPDVVGVTGKHHMKLLIFDPTTETIVAWKH